MRAIGVFRELVPGAVHGPSVFAAAGKLSGEQARMVASYLGDGEAIVDSMEAVADPFSPGRFILGGSGLVATSRFVYRQALPDLVERYCVAVDADVLNASKAQERLSSGERQTLLDNCASIRALYYAQVTGADVNSVEHPNQVDGEHGEPRGAGRTEPG
jgi:hypothetical protein